MHTRLLAAAAAILFTAITPGLAQAHDHGWDGRSHMRELREACDWGNRRACVRLGREIEQRREARREARRQWGYTPQQQYWSHDPWRAQRWDPYRRGW